MENILKVEFYDDFSCIADRCSFTCCKGWEVLVDADTYHRWKTDKVHGRTLYRHVRVKNTKAAEKFSVKMNEQKICPFLDNKGLCNIVKEQGEEYLPHTCREFPRLISRTDHRYEFSLSCACPVVVDMLYGLQREIKFLPEGIENIPEENIADQLRFRIREGMLVLLHNDLFSLKERLLLISHMLVSLFSENDIIIDSIEKYQAEEYLKAITGAMSKVPFSMTAARQERKELFLDIIWNYKEEEQYQEYLKELSVLTENIEMKEDSRDSKRFRLEFSKYTQLLENSLTLKIFSNCMNESFEDTLLSYQMILLEYIMLEYTAYLNWQQGRMEDQSIMTGIVIYTRMIEYNYEGIKEYLEESFENAIWDLGYLLLLLEAI